MCSEFLLIELSIYIFFVLYWKDDLDELEVYGKEEQSGFKLTSYTFEVSVSMGYKFL